jgi:hypothetical protein
MPVPAAAACYKQLESSVGQCGTDVLLADTAALKTGSASNDGIYKMISGEIKHVGSTRDALATQIKGDLFKAEFDNVALPGTDVERCQAFVAAMHGLLAARAAAVSH